MNAVRLLPLLLFAALVGSGCTKPRPTADADAAAATASDASGADVDPARRLFEALDAHCGRAVPGVLEGDAPSDAEPAWSAAEPVLHVRVCEPSLKALAVARGEDRSVVWLLSVRDGSLRLQHLAYNDDATPRPGSGRFSVASADSTAGRVEFEPEFIDPTTPAPSVSIALDDGALVYESAGAAGPLRVRFDLRNPVPAPPAPWLEAPIR